MFINCPLFSYSAYTANITFSLNLKFCFTYEVLTFWPEKLFYLGDSLSPQEKEIMVNEDIK